MTGRRRFLRGASPPPHSATLHRIHYKDHFLWLCLWALVMGPFDSGGVCSMGPCLLYGIWSVWIPILGAIRKSLDINPQKGTSGLALSEGGGPHC